jgi:hypothetical protein
MNPNAIVMWAIFALVGFLIGGVHAAIIGLVIGFSVSLLISLRPFF